MSEQFVLSTASLRETCTGAGFLRQYPSKLEAE